MLRGNTEFEGLTMQAYVAHTLVKKEGEFTESIYGRGLAELMVASSGLKIELNHFSSS